VADKIVTDKGTISLDIVDEIIKSNELRSSGEDYGYYYDKKTNRLEIGDVNAVTTNMYSGLNEGIQQGGVDTTEELKGLVGKATGIDVPPSGDIPIVTNLTGFRMPSKEKMASNVTSFLTKLGVPMDNSMFVGELLTDVNQSGMGILDATGIGELSELAEGFTKFQSGLASDEPGVALGGLAQTALGAVGAYPFFKTLFDKASPKAKEALSGLATKAREYKSSQTPGTKLLSTDPTDPAVDAIIKLDELVNTTKEKKSNLIFAPEGKRANTVPHQILVENTANTEVVTPVTQAFIKTNKENNIKNIDLALENNPNALLSEDAWIKFESETMGGEYVPVPPLQAIKYAQNPNLMADKLKKLTPEMKAGVDEGFGYVKGIRSLYEDGSADLGTTADLFIWGILSRGAGPVQQEGAFIDIIDGSRDLIDKAINGTFTKADQKLWQDTIKKLMPSGSPGKQVTMNVNATGQLLFELGKIPEGRSETVLQTIHSMIGDPNISAKDIRREFMTLTDGAGIDNKVVSFILLVAGRDDVLVMDRIQGRHLWDDGTFKGFNLYDGYKKEGTTMSEGLQSVFRGPRGLLLTEALENGLRGNIEEVYKILGRPEDASLGRWHWENWVIEGEQVVSHSTLKGIVDKSATGISVTEGKPGTFSSGSKYIKLEDGKTYIEYPLSDGATSLMTPSRHKEFLTFIKNPKNGIVPNDFKVTENKDIPWYEREEVNRQKLDQVAKNFSDAEAPKPTEGTVTGSRKSEATNVKGNQPSKIGGDDG